MSALTRIFHEAFTCFPGGPCTPQQRALWMVRSSPLTWLLIPSSIPHYYLFLGFHSSTSRLSVVDPRPRPQGLCGPKLRQYEASHSSPSTATWFDPVCLALERQRGISEPLSSTFPNKLVSLPPLLSEEGQASGNRPKPQLGKVNPVCSRYASHFLALARMVHSLPVSSYGVSRAPPLTS